MPLLAGQLPYLFDNGFSIERFAGGCGCCASEIGASQMRGSLTRPRHDMLVIEAIGVCERCRVATTFLLRLNEQGDYTTMVGHQWRRGKMPVPWRIRLVSFLAALFRSKRKGGVAL